MADDFEITVTVTRSKGDDRAVVILVDTDFEPDGSDGGPGLRILTNDYPVYTGKPHAMSGYHRAKAQTLVIHPDAIPYLDTEEN